MYYIIVQELKIAYSAVTFKDAYKCANSLLRKYGKTVAISSLTSEHVYYMALAFNFECFIYGDGDDRKTFALREQKERYEND